MSSHDSWATRLGMVALVAAMSIGADESKLEEVVVRAEASILPSQGGTGSIAVVDAEAIELTRANHVHELLVRVPGVWISRGSGHEHLTAIRSGVLTGAGACGEFLILENGIPIRPAGFCNVNNLFEVQTEQAAAIEVVRGPGSALFGGNALHGAINTVTAASADDWRGSFEAGPYDYTQVRLQGGSDRWSFSALSTASGGYRDDTGYGQQKAYLGFAANAGGWNVTNTVSTTLLNQETGGFVRGFRAYDSSARTTNPNPEAYRDAWSMRAASVFRRTLANGHAVTVTPYARRSSMAFLQHFLPGRPLEKNAQSSGGVALRFDGGETRRWSAGAVAELFQATLSERQDGATQGSAFLVATRPEGTHYDFDVAGVTLAAYGDLGLDLAPDVELVASARVERNSYDYENHHLVGNTRDDGTRCGFGGCLYTRPGNRDDAYTNVAGRLGVQWSTGPGATIYAVAGLGFRPPQTTELYRLQSGQTVADLDSERLRSLEAGGRGSLGPLDFDVAVYVETTRNLIFRDANGFNVSDGATDAMGIEADLGWSAGRHTVELAAAWGRHRYAFTRDAGRGERIVDGNDVDTAPRWLGSAHWRWSGEALTSEFEVAYIGSHFINAANTARYGGHALLSWRGDWDVTPRLRLFARLLNALDAAYADRADFAFGSYRYFPGMPRQVYLGVSVRFCRRSGPDSG
ncbi:MAG: TonB-dependent receptor [Gammaproteobacteria bacterium]|nr:TonB-dependent receptor [Gammaproteobacteria bacterium]MDE0443085.1 TonB-dependent receptor [Gammaproteobacteria bacterium]